MISSFERCLCIFNQLFASGVVAVAFGFWSILFFGGSMLVVFFTFLYPD